MSAPATTERASMMHRRRRQARRGFTWTPRRELLIVAMLFAFAVAARWPYLLRLPHFTDEIGEIRWALRIVRGEAFPLTAQVPYMGPYQHYLLAAVLKLVGFHVVLPRLLVLIIGALTAVLTYLLGRELAGRNTGLLAGLLLATLPQHIVVNSHVAWQNSTTPFYTTLAGWALLHALKAECDGWRADAAPDRAARTALADSKVARQRNRNFSGLFWLIAGLAYGVAVGTHLGAIVLVPALLGVVAIAIWRGQAWVVLRRPGPYLAVLAALLAYSPLLIANARNGMAGYWRMRGRDYAFVAEPTWATYRHGLFNLLAELARMISNPFRIPARRLDYLTSPYMLIAVALAVLGLLLLARRGHWLPLLAVAGTAAIMPYFNHAYGVEGDRYLVTGRYIAFLLPLLMIASATAVLALTRWFIATVPRRWRGLALRDAAIVAPVVLTALLVLYPLLPLERYYTHEAAQDPDNASFLETLRVVDALRGLRTPVLLDAYFNRIDLNDGAEALDILDILLTLDGVPHQIVDDPGAALRAMEPTLNPNDPASLPLVIMPRDRCWPLQNEIPLQRVSDTLLLNELYRYYAVYRYAPPPEPAACRTADQQGQRWTRGMLVLP